jgi:type II secretory pathway component PulF
MDLKKCKFVSLFFEKFGLMISSGVPLVRALNDFASDCPDEEFSKIIENISKGVSGGTIFHECLEALELPKSAMDMIIAGEKNAELDVVCLRVARVVAIHLEMSQLMAV